MYWHYLARDLGMSLRRVRQEVSSREFIKHIAYYQLNGRPEDKLETQLAVLNMNFFNANIDTKKTKPITDIEKFMIQMPLCDRLVNGTKEEQEANNIEAKLMQFTQAYNVGNNKNGNNK